MTRTKVSTVILSDVHIGSEHSKVKELTSFLKNIDCDKLILNGDILDGWKLQRNPFGRWKRSYTELIKVIMKMMEKHGTKVIYVRGNHDDFLDKILPLSLPSVSLVKDYVHISHGKRYYVTHGDVFDNISTHLVWLAKLGDYGYSALLWINRILNNYRRKQGKPYYSFSQSVKHKVKSAVSYISDFTVCQTQGKICRILYFRFREGTDSTCSSPSFRRNYLRTYSSAGKYMVWKYSLSQFW